MKNGSKMGNKSPNVLLAETTLVAGDRRINTARKKKKKRLQGHLLFDCFLFCFRKTANPFRLKKIQTLQNAPDRSITICGNRRERKVS